MFSVFSSRRKGVFVKKALPLVLAFCFVVTLFSGCDLDDGNKNTGFIPEGTWSSVWAGNAGVDIYTVENKTLTYTSTPTDGTSSGWAGTIVDAVDFVSESSGVLIVEYTTPPSGDFAGVHGGDYQYTGVYYKEYSAAEIKMADAWTPYVEGTPSYRIEAETLGEARELFTEGNVGTHVGMWGTYTK
jgi:hypothetical protein